MTTDSESATSRVWLCNAGDVPRNGMQRFRVGDADVLVADVGGTLYAISDRCTHSEASLCEGELLHERCAVECSLHGAVFDLRTGAALEFPAERPVRCYRTELSGRDVFVYLSEEEAAVVEAQTAPRAAQ